MAAAAAAAAAHKKLMRECRLGQRDKALDLLDGQPHLLNEGWGGEQFFAARRCAVYHGMTPLMAAAARGEVGLIEALLERGAVLAAQDADGFDALTFSAWKGHIAATASLLKKLGTANSVSGSKALHFAVLEGHIDVVELLLADAADPVAAAKKSRSNGSTSRTFGWGGEMDLVDLFAFHTGPDTLKGRQGRKRLVAALETCTNPAQIELRLIEKRENNWSRRKAFVAALVGADLLPSAARRKELEDERLPSDAMIPALSGETGALVRDKVLGNLGLAERVAGFL